MQSPEETLQGYKNIIDDMLLDERYEFADDFLRSVRDQIEEKNRISKKQMDGVVNIMNSLRE